MNLPDRMNDRYIRCNKTRLQIRVRTGHEDRAFQWSVKQHLVDVGDLLSSFQVLAGECSECPGLGSLLYSNAKSNITLIRKICV